MTTLTIFTPEITTLESQLSALQTQLDELRQAEQTAAQLLSTLADSLPRFEKLGAIARIKTAVLGLFGETNAPKFQDFMTEVPATIEPTSEEIFDAEVLPQPAPEPKQLTIEDAIAEAEATPKQAEPTVEETSMEQINQSSKYVEQVNLTRTVAYQRRNHDGEIVCAYLGANTQKLAQNWAECLELWGCRVEVRKAKRMSAADIRWEVKIWNISKEQLDRVAASHTTPFQSVPAPQATRQQVKKSALQPNPSALNGGATCDERNDASNAAPQVSLVLGKADNIYTTYHVYVEGKEVGRVERMSATSAWSVPGMPGIWETKEEAADALIAKREADRKLHQDTNDLLRAKYGLPV